MALFDAVAQRYDAFCTTPLGHFVERIERGLILELLRPRQGESILDLGCGTGAYVIALAELGCAVTGVDVSSEMLARARAKAGAGLDVRFLEADIARLPLQSEAFDAALLQVTLEFVANPGPVLMEATRVLRPGGRLVVGLIQGAGPWARSYRQRAREDPASVYRHARFWTLAELEELVGMSAADVRAGLFVGPEEFRDLAQAEELELSRSRCPQEEAGFVAARFDRLPSPTLGK